MQRGGEKGKGRTKCSNWGTIRDSFGMEMGKEASAKSAEKRGSGYIIIEKNEERGT